VLFHGTGYQFTRFACRILFWQRAADLMKNSSNSEGNRQGKFKKLGIKLLLGWIRQIQNTGGEIQVWAHIGAGKANPENWGWETSYEDQFRWETQFGPLFFFFFFSLILFSTWLLISFPVCSKLVPSTHPLAHFTDNFTIFTQFWKLCRPQFLRILIQVFSSRFLDINHGMEHPNLSWP
jgi:hypothetical protein